MNTRIVAALLAVAVGLAGCGTGKKAEPGPPSGHNYFLKVFKAKPLGRSGGPRGSKELFNKSQAEPQGCI